MKKNFVAGCLAVSLMFLAGAAEARQERIIPCNKLLTLDNKKITPDFLSKLVKMAQTAVNRQSSPWEVDPSCQLEEFIVGDKVYETLNFYPKNRRQSHAKYARVYFASERPKLQMRSIGFRGVNYVVVADDHNYSRVVYCINGDQVAAGERC